MHVQWSMFFLGFGIGAILAIIGTIAFLMGICKYDNDKELESYVRSTMQIYNPGKAKK